MEHLKEPEWPEWLIKLQDVDEMVCEILRDVRKKDDWDGKEETIERLVDIRRHVMPYVRKESEKLYAKANPDTKWGKMVMKKYGEEL